MNNTVTIVPFHALAFCFLIDRRSRLPAEYHFHIRQSVDMDVTFRNGDNTYDVM